MKRVVFAGNPNVGKSAWINALSDAHFKVGNWPGVTVEKKEAIVEWENEQYELVDLPGAYQLEGSKSEEAITAGYLKEESIDLIVNVVDATNLARNLYLTLKLRQYQIPMIIIFNFMDEVKRYEITIDIEQLRKKLQVPILPYSALNKEGIDDVKQTIIDTVNQKVYYAPCIAKAAIEPYLTLLRRLRKRVPLYMELKENELALLAYDLLYQKPQAVKQLKAWQSELDEPEYHGDEDVDCYRYIEELMIYVEDNETRLTKTRRLDQILLHPLYGMIALALIMSLLLLFVFRGSAPFNDFIDFCINDLLMRYANAALFFLPDGAKSLVLHGIIAGVGGVLVFIPLMSFLTFALALLEESGYMARIAYLLDHAMQNFHLSGKSFVSLLLGFGCNVPAIYATRTLDHEKQKKLTALLIPFMSCGARLPVYMLFAAAFFPQKAAFMVLSIYGIGILAALIVALVCSHFTSFHDDELMLLELPPYRMPCFKVIWNKMKQEVMHYIHRACGVVLWAMVILWALSYFPNGNPQTSLIAHFAKQAAPVYEPLGFGDRWECVAALPSSIIAKETVVGFMDQTLLQQTHDEIAPIDPLNDAYELVEAFQTACIDFTKAFLPQRSQPQQKTTLVSAIQGLWTDETANARAYSYMVYLLLSIPCIMSLQALWREYGWKLALLSVLLMILIPYITSFTIYQLLVLLL